MPCINCNVTIKRGCGVFCSQNGCDNKYHIECVFKAPDLYKKWMTDEGINKHFEFKCSECIVTMKQIQEDMRVFK